MPTRPAYFETQSLLRCGAHALNNLLGARAFEPGELDALAVEAAAFASGAGAGLPFALSMRTPVLGNYDVSVLEIALSRQHAGRCADRYETARFHPTGAQHLPADAAYPGGGAACRGCGGSTGGGAEASGSAAAGGGAAASGSAASVGGPAPGVLLGFLIRLVWPHRKGTVPEVYDPPVVRSDAA